ncbi:MAG: hypothetical protein ACFFBL_13065 [Promethearchaeota archaeon]
MSKLEEVSSKQLILINSFEAKLNHLQVLVFNLLISTVYNLCLWFICSAAHNVLSALLLFGSQMAIGLPAIRAFYDLGVSNKEKLHFIDPPDASGREPTHEVVIHPKEISLIFEKLDLQIHKYDDGSLDDLRDLAWFGILVWAAISSTLFYFEIGGYPLCFAGTLVFILTTLGSYLSGYWSQRNIGFEDDLSHLQYYVERRFKSIDEVIPDREYRLSVHVMEKRHSLVIMEFTLEIDGENIVLIYHIGFPSREKERIVVRGNNDLLEFVYAESLRSQIISENNWTTERITTPSNSVIVVNESSDFSVSNRSSFVSMPSMIDDSSKTTAQTFLEILSFTKSKSLI